MLFSRLFVLATLLPLVGLSRPAAQEVQKAETPKAKSVEELAKSAPASVVVITVAGRDGKQHGLGSGFVVAADGLIATNLHVIGEARPVTVQTADGKRHAVTSVHASDRSLDLALLRIDAKNLKPLDLGDSDKLENGQAVVALGHPHGLQHSVVSGVVSGRPKIDDRPMIQIAIPIEKGNSGGPLLDMHGKVQGIVTLKSQLTPNLGFAVPVNALKTLVRKPNPIAMERWITIGTLNPEDWTPVFEGRWRQRNGKIIVDGPGSGFGGRSLCLSKREAPKAPFEIAVTLRLADEAGAGGLIFHADGADKHYGFYPSAGHLRLSRFQGPDVFSWKVLHNQPSAHYRPGDWNTIKVRIEPKRILGYVNDKLVVESDDDTLTSGKVGLAKFRDSHVEFKNFQVAAKIPSSTPAPDLVARITKTVTDLAPQGPPKPALIEKLLPDAPLSMNVLKQRAQLLEQQATQLRELAQAIHHHGVLNDLAKVAQGKEEAIDLLHAALLIAKLDLEELDVDAYRKQVERMGREIGATMPKKADEQAKLAVLNKDLFSERGFHGSRGDYYSRSNSYLSEVIDDREGLPITLSVLYMEIARGLGLKVEGIGLPGHFVVEHRPSKGPAQLIDVYEGGKAMSRADADKKVQAITGEPLREADLAPVGKRAILVRILTNLVGIAEKERDAASYLRYHDAIVIIHPEAYPQRLSRAAARFHLGDKQGALADLDWLLDHNPPELDRERVLELRRLWNRK
jgi:serine protease Do